MKLRRLLYFIIALPLMAGFAACGSDDEEEPAPAPQPVIKNFEAHGATTTYPVSNPTNVYTSTRGVYTVSINTTTLETRVYIDNADFMQGMPAGIGVMTLAGIKAQKSDANVTNPGLTPGGSSQAVEVPEYYFSASAIIPSIGERPYPDFAITDLSGTVYHSGKVEIDFICNYRNTPMQVKFAGE